MIETNAEPIDRASGAFGPWNPGIESTVPRRVLALATLFRTENVSTSLERAEELHDLTGLETWELVAFRPQRLLLHELLVRVTADLSVPDGARVEDLGINFRAMTATILARYIEPRMAEVEKAYDAARRELGALIGPPLAQAFAAPEGRTRRGLFDRLLRGTPPSPEDAEARTARLLAEWESRAQGDENALVRAAFRAIVRVVSAVRIRHGRLWGEPALLAAVAVDLACNDYASDAIGRLIAPWVAEAAGREGFAILPSQPQPVVMNTKGASASGKSTMRPLQRRLAGEIGVDWSHFALISPDIWRKQLLDYGSLGEAYKYAGALTGEELRLVDQKLDRYMAAKAERGGMSHLLIDRFRFDSFAPESDEAGSNLLTRFGHDVYLFFMITPPHETVERSWKRGLEVGRYKAVDDLLAHNVEAYTGMPELFFTWARRADKSVHYEFLDNSVPPGERPRTAAFGWNAEMNVLDVKCLLDIARYAKIHVDAAGPAEVYRDREAMAPGRNTDFLVQCARQLAALNFADRDSGRIYARVEAGALAWVDRDALHAALEDPETRAGLLAIAPNARGARSEGAPRYLGEGAVARLHTLGRWGGARRAAPQAASG